MVDSFKKRFSTFSTKAKAETAKGPWDKAKTEDAGLSFRKSEIYPILYIFIKFMVSKHVVGVKLE